MLIFSFFILAFFCMCISIIDISVTFIEFIYQPYRLCRMKKWSRLVEMNASDFNCCEVIH